MMLIHGRIAGNDTYYDEKSLEEVLHEIKNTEIYHQFLFLLFPRPLTAVPFGLPLGLAEVEIDVAHLDDK